MYDHSETSPERYEEAARVERDRYDEVAAKASPSKLPLSSQEKGIALLHQAIDELAARIKPVLEPEYSADGKSEVAEKEREGSPLREQMLANNRGIDRAVYRLRALIERIEC